MAESNNPYFYNEDDLNTAVEYASELSEKYTEAELLNILSELNFK